MKQVKVGRRLTVASSSLQSAPDKISSKSGLFQSAKKQTWTIPIILASIISFSLSGRQLSKTTFLNFAKIFGAFSLISAFMANIKTRQRQSEDATSEWQRYAQNPGSRGRAIMVLMTKQLCLIVAAKIASLFGKKSSKRAASLRQYAGRKFSNGILKLGPLYIKLGQIVSCRPGLLGEEWVDALSDLQDKVPARTGQNAMELVYSALDGGKEEFDQLFQDFDSTPLAAASLGQVHRAKLRKNGNEVALKVQRPHLKQIYDQDFALLTTIAKWMDRLSRSGAKVGGVESSWTGIFADAESILYREIDYRDEAENAARFAKDFGLGIGGTSNPESTSLARNNETLPDAAEWLRTPYIYTDLSNERILVQEYVPSFKVTDEAKLDEANVSQEDRIKLADDLARAYLRQFCSNLFFSTDPHPGNIGVELVPATSEESSSMKPRLVMYDFGQASSLTRNQADGILEIIEAIIDTDVDRSITAFQKMGVLVDGADLDKVRKKVAENYKTGKIKANRKKLSKKGFKFRDEEDATGEPSTAASEDGQAPNDAEVMSYFTLPAEYAFVARAISQMDGVGKSLDPDFDFISNAAPYIVEIKGADLYVKDEVEKFFRSLQDRIKTFFQLLEKKLEELQTSFESLA